MPKYHAEWYDGYEMSLDAEDNADALAMLEGYMEFYGRFALKRVYRCEGDMQIDI